MDHHPQPHTSTEIEQVLQDFLTEISTKDLSYSFLDKLRELVEQGQMRDKQQIAAAIALLKGSRNE